MGFSSVWAAITGSRVKEISSHRPFSFEQQECHARELAALQAHSGSPYGNHAAAYSAVQLNQASARPEDKKAKRRSRGFSLSKTKSESDLKKRRSWFGGRPAAEDAPAVPALPKSRPVDSGIGWGGSNANAVSNQTRPGTALTTDNELSWSRPTTPQTSQLEKRKSKRLSLSKALSSGRTRSKSIISQPPQTPKLQKRQSVLGGHRNMAPEASPAPAFTPEQTYAEPAMSPLLEDSFNKRRSMQSLHRTPTVDKRKSTASVRSQRSQRNTWWQSSNPDDDNAPPPVPSVPSLGWSGGTATPDSSIAHTASPDYTYQIEQATFAANPIRTVTRGSSIKHPRPVSGVSLSSRKSYKPKNAATGFLKSTSQRSSRRHSLLDDGDGGTYPVAESSVSGSFY